MIKFAQHLNIFLIRQPFLALPVFNFILHLFKHKSICLHKLQRIKTSIYSNRHTLRKKFIAYKQYLWYSTSNFSHNSIIANISNANSITCNIRDMLYWYHQQCLWYWSLLILVISVMYHKDTSNASLWQYVTWVGCNVAKPCDKHHILKVKNEQHLPSSLHAFNYLNMGTLISLSY